MSLQVWGSAPTPTHILERSPPQKSFFYSFPKYTKPLPLPFSFFCNFSALAPRSRPCPGGGWYFPAGKSKWPEMRRGRKEGVPAPGSTSVCNCIVAHQLSNANKKIVATFSVKSFTLANGYAVNIGASNEIQKSTRAWLMIRCNDGPLLMDPLRRSSNSKFANISHFCDDHLLCSHCAFTFHRRNIRRELSLFTVCELDW